MKSTPYVPEEPGDDQMVMIPFVVIAGILSWIASFVLAYFVGFNRSLGRTDFSILNDPPYVSFVVAVVIIFVSLMILAAGGALETKDEKTGKVKHRTSWIYVAVLFNPVAFIAAVIYG